MLRRLSNDRLLMIMLIALAYQLIGGSIYRPIGWVFFPVVQALCWAIIFRKVR